MTPRRAALNLFKGLGIALMLLTYARPVRAQSACEVDYRINSQWNVGFNVTITLRNPTAQAIQGWRLSWDMTRGERVRELWNGSPTQNGSNVQVTNLSYNALIRPGGNVVLGFNGAHNGTVEVPGVFYLNGIACGDPMGGNAPQPMPQPPTSQGASRFLEPVNGAIVPRNFLARMKVDGFTVEPAGMARPGAGHLHILVDTDFITPGQPIPFDAMHIHYGKGQVEAMLALPPGPHTLRLQFADGLHVALPGDAYRDTINIVVAENMIQSPQDGATVPPTFDVVMNAAGVIVEPAGMVRPGAGHLHLLVDTDFILPGQPIPFDTMHLHYGKGQTMATLTLAPGPHTIKLQFADGLHVALPGIQYRDEISVVVADPNTMPPMSGMPGSPTPTPTPTPSPTPTPAPQPMPTLAGESLYASQCAGCHGDDGKGIGTFPSVLRGYPTRDAYLQKIILTMPLGNPNACLADCAEAITQYVEKVLLPKAGIVGSVVAGDRMTTMPPATPPPTTTPTPTPTPAVCTAETPGVRSLRLLTHREYDNTTKDLLGVTTPLSAGLPIEARVLGYDNNADANVVTARHIDTYLSAAQDLATSAIATNRAALVPCNAQADREGCSRQVVTTLGQRAYRRPLVDTEINALLGLMRAGASFDDGLRSMISALLISPNFLYRSEIGVPSGTAGQYKLTPYETASALSYLFWGTMPDATLFADAAGNRLSTPDQLASEAQRLLADPRARRQIGVFAGEWLSADPVLTGEKDPKIYPNYTTAVQTASDDELVAFVNNVIFDSTGRFPELFNADYVFANDALAKFYGLASTGGTQLRRVPVPNASRGGVLGLASVLARQAHSDDSSPVKRGVFVRKRLLCHELPPPPPAVDNTPPGLDPTLTTRARFMAHSASPFCSACHQYIDGVGFGLEAYNGAGEYRMSENGVPIDDSGSIKALTGFDPTNLNGSVSVTPYRGLRQLSTLVGGTPDAPACLAKQYFRYARGATETAADSCTLARMNQQFADSSYDLKTLLISIVNSPSFTLRRDR